MNDPLQLTLTSGETTLAVVALRGDEAISRLYRFELDVMSNEDGGPPDDIGPGADATLTFQHGDTVVRTIHGLIASRQKRIDNEHDDPVYSMVLVPHLFRATLVKAQQIFLGKSVVEIIQDKLALIGITGDNLSMSQLGSYPARDFVVQYEETDLDFIGRLAEHLGISFYFEQLNNEDQLVFADGPGDFSVNAQATSVVVSDALNAPDRIYTLDVTDAMTPGLRVVYDYNYRRPDLSLVGNAEVADGHGGGILEYGCHVKDQPAATALAAIRAEETGCRMRRYRGESSIVNMVAGGVTQLDAGPDIDSVELLITAVQHEITLQDGKNIYRNTFDALETTTTYRPERVTPRPRIHGFVTGVVQGPPGAVDAESPHLDVDGRYLVQFHFDAGLGDPRERGSHFVRMSQPFGGTGHGMHFPLRPGTEVIIAFANGDPDRPIIVGAIPNAHTRTPVTASNPTQNRITAASGAFIEISERK